MDGSAGRLINKPPSFNGDEASWSEWSFLMRSFLVATGVTTDSVLSQVEKNPQDMTRARVRELARQDAMNLIQGEAAEEVAARREAYVQNVVKNDEAMYYVMASTCRSSALSIIRDIGVGQGLFTWQALYRRYEGTSATTATTSLMKILNLASAAVSLSTSTS